MRILAALAAGTLTMTLSGCLIEAERANIWLQNNSDQTITLQKVTAQGPQGSVTAKPHATQKGSSSSSKGECLLNWEIVDSEGKVLRRIEKVCAYDTVVYP